MKKLISILVCATLAGLFTPTACAFADITLGKGGDLLMATGTLHVNVPAGFFGNGAPAVVADLNMVGLNVETVGPYEVGTTSMIVRRKTQAILTYPSSGAQAIPLEVTDLGLQSASPLIVQMPAGDPTNWSATLLFSSDPPSIGSYMIERTSESGGTLSASMSVRLRVMFRSRGTRVALDLGLVQLSGAGGTWTVIPGSPSESLAVAGLPVAIAPSITLSSAELSLTLCPSQVNPNRPGPAYVDPNANVNSNVGSLGRYCSISSGVTIGAGAVIGSYAVLLESAVIGTSAIIGDHASIGSGTAIGDGAFIDSGVVVGAGCTIGPGAHIGKNTNIGAGCQVLAGAYVGGGCVIRTGSSIAAGVHVGNDVQTGSSVTLATGSRVSNGGRISAGATVSAHVVNFQPSDGTAPFSRMLPASNWTTPPLGWVMDDAGAQHPETNAEEGVLATIGRIDPLAPPPGYGELASFVGTEFASVAGGGTGQVYTPGVYQCGYYAESLRSHLASPAGGGHTTSFTCIYPRNPDWAWWKFGVSYWGNGHCLVDVHFPNGQITWLEAQDAGGNIGYWDRVLSGDDQSVTYFDHNSGWGTSDGDYQICVYDNRAQAEADGHDIPGQ